MTPVQRIEAAARAMCPADQWFNEYAREDYLREAQEWAALLYPELHGDSPTHLVLPYWFFVARVSDEAFEWAKLSEADIEMIRAAAPDAEMKTFEELRSAYLNTQEQG